MDLLVFFLKFFGSSLVDRCVLFLSEYRFRSFVDLRMEGYLLLLLFRESCLADLVGKWAFSEKLWICTGQKLRQCAVRLLRLQDYFVTCKNAGLATWM